MRVFILIAPVLLCFLTPLTHAVDRPTVGAIRWDAWTGGSVTAEVERSLGPAKYRHRLPWFSQIAGDDQVRIDGSPQQVMDREIDFAAGAGIDYWAFLLYPQSSGMSVGLGQYLKSARRERLKFCVILHNALGVGAREWPDERKRIVGLMKEPGYQTVLSGRPLVYAFGLDFKEKAGAKPGGQSPADRLAELRRAAKDAGLNPYFVYMGWHPPTDYRERSAQGFDAVSAYAWPGEQPTFAELARSAEAELWQSAAREKVPYIPLVTTGWDKQPRKDHPVSWEKDAAYQRQRIFPSAAAPQEIAGHLRRALTYVGEHSDLCAANTIVIYAWNEHDEGGWLSPTWTATEKPDTSRLDAIREVLRPVGK